VELVGSIRYGSLPVGGETALAFAISIAAFTSRVIVAAALVDVGQQRKLTSTLDGARDLALVAAACAGDPARADLALLGDEFSQGHYVLVVDLLDLVAAMLARLTPSDTGPTLLISAPDWLAATALCHWDSLLLN
jgi:hypothetical protein